jgi:hypothetical protein
MTDQDVRFRAPTTTGQKSGANGSPSAAALYIDPLGPYPKLLGPEFCWDASRDARKYDGPHPVVAHPPCRHWSKLRHLAHWDCSASECGWYGTAQDAYSPDSDDLSCPECGSELTSDRDCAPRAVEQVRAWGGVLEHPAGSQLWSATDLPYPRRCSACDVPRERCYCGPVPTDVHGGFTIEVDQVEWGHVARKRTWLYLVGVPREALSAPPFPGREPTHYASGGRTKSSRTGGAVPPGMKVCSAQQRRRTPPLFAQYLVSLARAAAKERAA